MAGDLRTTPQAIVAVGMTVDGREITEQDIDDIVETYNYNKYGARINLDHEGEWGGWLADNIYKISLNGGMLGDVIEVSKGENDEGITCLYAVLCPNASMITLNQADQAVYYSIEIDRDFMGSGQTYLVGLAMTDYPASTYTTRANFNKRNKNPNAAGDLSSKTGLPELTLSLDLPQLNFERKSSKPPFSFKHLFSSKKDNEMTPEQLGQALKDAIGEPLQQLSQSIASQGEQISQLSASRSDEDNAPTTPGDDSASDDKTKVSGFSKEQEGRIKGLEDNLGEVQTSIENLSDLVKKAAGMPSGNTTESEDEHNGDNQYGSLL